MNLARHQRELRKLRNENAFLFDEALTQCFGQVPREQWEEVISACGGRIWEAAAKCGFPDLPQTAKCLWGRSAEEAKSLYRAWLEQKSRRRSRRTKEPR